jgi:hypothetical protein
MSGQLFTMDTSTHKTVQELLPWFVTETLGSDELVMVQDHLRVCTQCQSDVDWQRTLQAVNPDTNPAGPDVERALARVLPRLDAPQMQKRKTLSDLLSNLSANLFSEFFKTFRGGAKPWMGWMLAAQTVAIVCLTVILIPQIGDSAQYRLLGVARNDPGNIVVVFKPETTEQDLRRILRASGARVVDGPTVTDAYLIKVDDARLTWVVNNLRSERAVALAESLESGGRHE